ncbi:hypothetical protein HY469_05825 [Candidatus Roizmanbacteria bacterium]|nr:hypothetical protein [Candidatus Roizmanbacteria bacterium]
MTEQLENSQLPTEIETKHDAIEWDEEDYIEEGNRFGYIYDVIEDPNQFELVDEVLAKPFDEHFTRNIASAAITRSCLAGLSEKQRETVNNHLEGIIPLEDTGLEPLHDCFLVFFGSNHPSRITAQDQIDQEQALVRKIIQETSSRQQSEVPSPYRMQAVSRETDKQVLSQAVKLLSSTGWDMDYFMAMLDDQTGIAGVAIDESSKKPRVVSVVTVEYDPYSFRRGGQDIELRLHEFSAGVTHPSFRGKGIYTQLSGFMLGQLAQADPDMHLGIGYSNATDEGMLRAAHRIGRSFSIPIAEKLGFTIRPMMQHFPVDAEYKDDVFTFMAGNEIRRRAQSYSSPSPSK